MAVILANNATSLLASNLSSGATTLVVSGGDASKFPAPTGGNWFPVTVIDNLGNMEIMRCTARSGANLTVTRAQEGTSALAFTTGARVDCRFTAAALADIVALIVSSVATGVAPKLDASAYNAPDVLTKLLTVDANDSGINATTVNGANLASLRDAAQLTGVLDPARIPVIATQKQVISSSATIAGLSGPEQADVTGAGVVVTTTDGRRWIYKGSGSKTAEASYIEMGDVTPDWAAIQNKPDATQSAAGLMTAGDKTIVDRGSRGHSGSTTNLALDATYLGKSITAAGTDQTITLPTIASVGGAGAVFGPIRQVGAFVTTVVASGGDTMRFTSVQNVSSIVLAQGQEVWLRATGPSMWTAYGYVDRVPILRQEVSNVASVAFTLPPGFTEFDFDLTGLIAANNSQDLLVHLSVDGGASYNSSANAYNRADVGTQGGGSVGGGWQQSTNMRGHMYLSNTTWTVCRGRLSCALDASKRTMWSCLSGGDRASLAFSTQMLFGERTANEVNNAIRFTAASGNLSGRFTMFGVN